MANRLIISEKEKESVLRLDGAIRYSYFVKRVVDWESAWGLWRDGWALAGDDSGQATFPFWPAREYAEVCALGHWAGCQPEHISLDDLLRELLPQLESEGGSLAVFPTPSNRGILVSPSQLADNLNAESEKYSR